MTAQRYARVRELQLMELSGDRRWMLSFRKYAHRKASKAWAKNVRFLEAHKKPMTSQRRRALLSVGFVF